MIEARRELLDRVRAEHLDYVRCQFIDLSGILRGRAVHRNHLPAVLESYRLIGAMDALPTGHVLALIADRGWRIRLHGSIIPAGQGPQAAEALARGCHRRSRREARR